MTMERHQSRRCLVGKKNIEKELKIDHRVATKLLTSSEPNLQLYVVGEKRCQTLICCDWIFWEEVEQKWNVSKPQSSMRRPTAEGDNNDSHLLWIMWRSTFQLEIDQMRVM